jgi:hypothetical protein
MALVFPAWQYDCLLCALLEVLEALKAADVDARIRPAATTIYLALIEVELTAVIGVRPA